MSIDTGSILHVSMVGLFYLSVVIILWTICGSWLRKRWKQIYRDQQPEQAGLPNEVHQELHEASRRKIHDEHQIKAADYEERILRPREEARKAQVEKEFRRFAGPAWKGKGQPLGGLEDDNRGDLRRRQGGTSRDAAEVRKLPEAATSSLAASEPQPKPKMVVTLPEEPAEGTPEAVTVALRGLSTVKRRRFLKTAKVQVLLDWMVKQGYHPQLYTLFTNYPRTDLSTVTDQSLQEAGITHDVVVFVEERDAT